jgi:hypothetical protein
MKPCSPVSSNGTETIAAAAAGECAMNAVRILALLLIIAGGFGLAYGHFSFTKETHEAKIGPVELSVKEKQNVNIPDWIAAAAIGGGVLMLLLDRRTA